MGKRFDVVTPRPKYGGGDGDVWWHRVGSAYENDSGRITIYLDSVPVPDPAKENKVVMMLFEPREKDAPVKALSKKGTKTKNDADEDSIPF